jgi:hypothetical protein
VRALEIHGSIPDVVAKVTKTAMAQQQPKLVHAKPTPEHMGRECAAKVMRGERKSHCTRPGPEKHVYSHLLQSPASVGYTSEPKCLFRLFAEQRWASFLEIDLKRRSGTPCQRQHPFFGALPMNLD